jgi:hypothetical protein
MTVGTSRLLKISRNIYDRRKDIDFSNVPETSMIVGNFLIDLDMTATGGTITQTLDCSVGYKVNPTNSQQLERKVHSIELHL